MAHGIIVYLPDNKPSDNRQANNDRQSDSCRLQFTNKFVLSVLGHSLFFQVPNIIYFYLNIMLFTTLIPKKELSSARYACSAQLFFQAHEYGLTLARDHETG
jgi:hypothetical protein